MAQIKKIKKVEVTLSKKELTTLLNALYYKRDREDEKYGAPFDSTIEMLEVMDEAFDFVSK